MRKHKKILFLLMTVLLIATACGQTAEKPAGQKQAISVRAQSVKQSLTLKQTLDYPAMVISGSEAKLIAKSGGTATQVHFNVGDKVVMGQQLVKIDDVNAGGGSGGGYNASQVKQASLAAQQAAENYRLAQKNYQNLLISSERDLNQVAIAKSQAKQGQSNLEQTTADALKSAELAYETAKVATEQARINLENRKKISGQSDDDTRLNAQTTAESAANTCNSTIVGINNIMAFDTTGGVSITYKDNLSALDYSAYSRAKTAYDATINQYNSFISADYGDISAKLDAVSKLVSQTKKLADATRSVLDKTISSANLPQSSAAGNSVSGFQSTVSGYQSTLSGTLSSVNGARQGLVNLGLNNNSTLDSLQKGYDLARKQEASAKQALDNLKSGNKSQKDNASFGLESASNQYDSIKVKLDSQISVSRSQLDLAQLSYSNALVSLQNLYDIHQVISPIPGTVTKKMVNEGDTVSAGQVLAVVSQPENIRLQFYIDQSELDYFRLGLPAKIKNEDKSYNAHVTGITPSADAMTKRFLVEVAPDKTESSLTLGTVMNVGVELTKKAQNKNAIILPLSAIEIGQNSNTIFIVKDGKAAKQNVTIVKVEGEAAEISVKLPLDAQIIVDGNKLVQEGDEVSAK